MEINFFFLKKNYICKMMNNFFPPPPRPLKLYVYNIDSDKCREVTVTPDDKWGGQGR